MQYRIFISLLVGLSISGFCTKELMSKTATKHKSYGMKVTSERLALINQIYKSGANVTIQDLTDNNGQPWGTQVTIKIPIE